MAPEEKRNRWLLPIGMGVAVFLVGGLLAALWLLGGEGDDVAAPAPVTPVATTEEPTEEPRPEQTTPAPAAPSPTEVAPEPVVETVFVTAQPEPSTPQPVRTVVVTAAPPADGERISVADAAAGLNHYLATVAGDPGAGWELLTYRRQAVEDWDSYQEFWSSIASARVSNCTVDEQVGRAQCTIHTTTKSGKSNSAKTALWVTREDGVVKIDVAGGGNPAHLDAEARLESYRADDLPWLSHDGRWVLVLSAKRPGITDELQTAANGTHTFYFPDILAEYESLASRLYDVDVLMLRTADFGKQGGTDLWFTVADPGGLNSEEDAKAWCAAAFPELSGKALSNQCLPRKMTAPHW